MSESTARSRHPLLLKRLRAHEVQAHLERDPRLLVPVGTTEQHGDHLPLGCDTLLVERLADDLSAEFRLLRAPTVEYGVNAPTPRAYPGAASVSRKTLSRFLNDLVGSWETCGVQQFIVLTAHGNDPHQEAVSTLRTRGATVRAVDIFAVPLHRAQEEMIPIHGGQVDTSLMLYVDASLVDLQRAQDYEPSRRVIRRYQRGVSGAIPDESLGSLGRPTLATAELGEELYRMIYARIAKRVLERPGALLPGSG